MINSYEYFKKQYLEPNGSNASWNTRDQHMLMTIMKLKEKIEESKIIIWAHNSHIGDSTATERGGIDFKNNNNWNLGQMCRAIYNNTYIIGLGNYDGNITAAYKWNSEHVKFDINKAIENSIENTIYNLINKYNIKNCIIDLKNIEHEDFNNYKNQRMIGVIYNSNTEMESHYISCIISKQYDLFIYISHINSLID